MLLRLPDFSLIAISPSVWSSHLKTCFWILRGAFRRFFVLTVPVRHLLSNITVYRWTKFHQPTSFTAVTIRHNRSIICTGRKKFWDWESSSEQLLLEMLKFQSMLRSPNHNRGRAAYITCSRPRSRSPEFRIDSLKSKTEYEAESCGWGPTHQVPGFRGCFRYGTWSRAKLGSPLSSCYENAWIGTATSNPLNSRDMWNQHYAFQLTNPRSSYISEGWHWVFHFHSRLSQTEVELTKPLLCDADPEPHVPTSK